MPSAQRIIEVAAGVVIRAGRLLITQRRSGDHLAGLWEFPGGKIEPGETPAECIVRELAEELGVTARADGVLREVSHAYPAFTVHLQFIRCHLIGGEPQPLGCQALAWVGREELADYAFPPADRVFLAELAERRDLWST